MSNSHDPVSELFLRYQSGSLDPLELGQRILEQAVQSKGSTTPDLDRERRCGYPEVIYGQGKTPESIRNVADALLRTTPEVLVTRVSPEQVRTLSDWFTFTRWSHVGRTLRIRSDSEPLAPDKITTTQREASKARQLGKVAVVSAGTTDEPVAIEALETLAWMNVETVLIQDIGVAGPYRLMAKVPKLREMTAIVCVAGMEGALPSVLAGHVACPVIAVPTSVGYGANFAGLSALLSMLNGCASNVAVVNIDAGFRGGYMAGLIAAAHGSRSTLHGSGFSG
jgi:pyridinium-3,5-biscarboxylic acid mononucleotide synthase